MSFGSELLKIKQLMRKRSHMYNTHLGSSKHPQGCKPQGMQSSLDTHWCYAFRQFSKMNISLLTCTRNIGCISCSAAKLNMLGLPADISLRPYSRDLARRGQMLPGFRTLQSAPACSSTLI